MRMQDEVLRLWEARGTTMLLVTHDIDEAIYMSDRIVIMTPRPGRIDRTIAVELDRPRQRNSLRIPSSPRRDPGTSPFRGARWRSRTEAEWEVRGRLLT